MATNTALDIIKLSLKDIGVLGIGDVLTDEEAQDSLDSFNMLLDTWSISRLSVFEEGQINFSLTGAQSMTIGPGGDIDVPRPLRLVSAYTNINGISYPMEILNTGKSYDGIDNKTIGAAFPTAVWYEQTYPLGTLWFYPLSGTGSAFMRFWSPLQELTNLNTVIALPKGYKAALRPNLAVMLASTFRRDPPASLVKTAKESLAALKIYNNRQSTMNVEATVVASRWRGGQYNILSDTP